ncbi:hypothetical protein WDW86_15485 [Bdellovibrionota bacterium FG-2]
MAICLGLSVGYINKMMEETDIPYQVYGRAEGERYGGVIRFYLPEVELWLQTLKAA